MKHHDTEDHFPNTRGTDWELNLPPPMAYALGGVAMSALKAKIRKSKKHHTPARTPAEELLADARERSEKVAQSRVDAGLKRKR